MVFFTETWRPMSFYDRLVENSVNGLHTLLLLDIKVKEQSVENLVRGRKIYEPPRFMTVSQAAEQMLEAEELFQKKVCNPSSMAVGIARLGASNQQIVAATLGELSKSDLGGPLHSLILIGTKVHKLEAEYLQHYAQNPKSFEEWQNSIDL